MRVFGLLLFSLALVDSKILDIEVKDECVQNCKLQKDPTDLGYCDPAFRCNIQCEEGCGLWRSALNTSCISVCNGTGATLTSRELYCIIGCDDALTRYFAELRRWFGAPPPPALVADSLTATSLRLEWNFPKAKEAGLRYFLQWHYEEHAGDWQHCHNQTWGPQDTVFVDNLQPYTKYRFRVALILSHLTEPILSPPSVVISTLAGGVPASPPVIVRAVAVDSTRVSVSWEPGPFLHGPLLSYVLRITDNRPHGYSALKDLSADNNFYIFRNLLPSHSYNVSISMRNGIGPGPSANVSIDTPVEPKAKDSEKPVLILGAHHVVIEQGTDMLDEPIILYNTNEFITGLAIHVSKCLLFVADSARYVHRMSLRNYINHSTDRAILSPSQMNFLPLDLSMDWLNDHIYILGEMTHQSKVWQVARCGLEGQGLTVAVAGLRNKPHHFEVDPYNGYLFWVTSSGLYRLDLSDISNGIKHNVQPELILSETNLGAFTVDHTNFSLLVANQNKNTVYAISLDGKEVSNMRPKIITSRLQKVVSLASANKKFYWTDGNEVLYEEYHSSSDSSLYFHNSYPLQVSKSYIKVLVNLTSSQPIPVPVNPPTSVQSIFGTDIAKTSWKMPHLLGAQGRGSWQNWSYEISIKEVLTNKNRLIRDINSTSYTIRDLHENTEYIIKCAAYTNFGQGPWSTEFIGRTLKHNEKQQPIILWSAVDGLLKSDASGENVETVIHKSLMQEYDDINDIAWYKDQLYLVTNTSQIVWYNMSSHKHQVLLDIDSVGSIAIDWIGKKLYWSSPKQKLIIRGNLDGTQQEPLPIVTSAKELNLDSLKAYLYWSTGHTVECAHLNGADRMIYHESQLFSGNLVMGLTLDMDHQFVYWIVRGSDGSNLYRAPMAGASKHLGHSPEKISSLQKPNMCGPLCYFNNRLIWLQDDKSAVISDLRGKYTATISAKSLSGLKMMYIMDSSQQIMPNASKHSSVRGISVIPDAIEQDSVKVIGTWQSFNITWRPVQNVNYGTVFYEVKIDSLSRNDSTILTTFPTLKYWQNVTPYSKLNVSLRALTYWGSSPQIKIKIDSPPSTPSCPEQTRAFVVHYSDSELVNITYRWDKPSRPNGVLEGYNVFWWSSETTNDSVVLDATDREYVVGNLLKNKLYYFRVQAFTEIGDGDFSEIIEVDTGIESPIPTLLIADPDSIYIRDIDLKLNYSLVHGISSPIEIGYLFRERKVLWVNDMQQLIVYNLATSSRKKILDVNAVSLSVDWIERSVYYVQVDESRSSVYKLDLNLYDAGIVHAKLIFEKPFVIGRIEVSPLSKKLYWMEEEGKTFRLMQSNADGSNTSRFFSAEDRQEDCNCPRSPQLERAFSLDHSDAEKPLINFIESSSQNIISSDKSGCKCKVILNNELARESWPIRLLKSDFGNLFWASKSPRGFLYSIKSNLHTRNLKSATISVQDLKIFGSHVQPLPSKDCLTPKIEGKIFVALINKTSNSILLKMPELRLDEACGNISMASLEYKVIYKEEAKPEGNSSLEFTFYDTLEVKPLKSYTKYRFWLTVKNYYMEAENDEELLALENGVVFQTAAGAPSPPRNVEVVVLNPALVRLNWLPPLEINGNFVYYVVHWQNEGSVNGIRQKGEQTIMENELASSYTTYLNKLSPNETYSIWVRAYSQNNETSSDSVVVRIQTFPEPENITVISANSSELFLQWNVSVYVQRYSIEYSLLTTNEWRSIDGLSVRGNSCLVEIEDLKPKTQYKFRLVLRYPNYEENYVWPKDARFTFETLGDRPSPPGKPMVQTIKDVYQVWWEASKDNGAPIEIYMLEILKLPVLRTKRSTNSTNTWIFNSGSDEENYEWEPIYNGTDTFWKISGLKDKYRYGFRVSSLNAFGWSDLSEESIEFDPMATAQLAEKQDITYIIIAVASSVIIVIIIICGKLCCAKNKKDDQHVVALPRGPDMELATLRELPRRGNFIHNTNVLYISAQITPDELNLLPHIRRDQITLMKFLGSGAFGEVFEGKAKGLYDGCYDTKVAVKTLRKGASDQEKTEFLQEAQLMSHFKHEHILQLLGVCLDNDPHFIIMELMQGGDLLTYLRSSRKSGMTTPSLNLLELIKMCVDVAKGCCYLEEMHFVHRDLACRNCLVSSTDPAARIVKIGDFGLARDIYKNDYYRKEGEGLLPVRWMAPESLVDGVFTCQSDVWAFGVLLWEIMTLGQQPYPARNNLEVLHYVRAGGRLGKPTDCPETLHTLMLYCWSYEPERRPTFKYCLDVLQKLHMDNLNSPMTGAHIGQYISTVPLQIVGVSNEAYFQDLNHNHSGGSWKSDEDAGKELTPFLGTENREIEIPKYLELLYEREYPLENDGYEVPRSVPCEVTKVNSECDDTNECKSANVDYTNMNLEQSKKST